jgi:hypothetical protein
MDHPWLGLSDEITRQAQIWCRGVGWYAITTKYVNADSGMPGGNRLNQKYRRAT